MRVHLSKERIGIILTSTSTPTLACTPTLALALARALARAPTLALALTLALTLALAPFEQPRHQLRLAAAHPEPARLETLLEQRDGQLT